MMQRKIQQHEKTKIQNSIATGNTFEEQKAQISCPAEKKAKNNNNNTNIAKNTRIVCWYFLLGSANVVQRANTKVWLTLYWDAGAFLYRNKSYTAGKNDDDYDDDGDDVVNNKQPRSE